MFTRGVVFNSSVFVKSANRTISFEFRVNLGGGEINEFSLSSNYSVNNFKFSFNCLLVGDHIISESGFGNFIS